VVKVSQQLDDRIASLVRGIEDERLWRADIELLLLGSKGVAFFHRRAFKVRKGYTTLFSNVACWQRSSARPETLTSGGSPARWKSSRGGRTGAALGTTARVLGIPTRCLGGAGAR